MERNYSINKDKNSSNSVQVESPIPFNRQMYEEEKVEEESNS